MSTRREFLVLTAAAFVLAAAPIATTQGCCVADGDLHALDCPVALADACDDCGAQPHQTCHYACSGHWR